MLGLGCSGRPPFNLKNSLDCIDYYLYSIEAWMKTSNYNSEEFCLMGHSLGGYLSTMYALKYPRNVKKLILFSPVGVPPQQEFNKIENVIERQPTQTRKILIKTVGCLWDWNTSPFSVSRSLGYYGANKMFTSYVEKRL
jgi:cardiolipin-specific phospholipase